AVGVGEAVAPGQFPAGGGGAGVGHLAGVGGEAGDCPADVAGGFRGGEVGVFRDGVAPGLGSDAEVVEDGFGAQESRGEGDDRDAVGFEFLGLGEGEADHRCLGQIVEQRATVAGFGAVGDFHDEPAGSAGHQGSGVPAGDDVGLYRAAQQPQAVVQVVFPERGVPLGERVTAPDVVDQQVEPAAFAGDPFDEGADLAGVGVVGLHGDAGAAGAVDQLGGLVDGLGALHGGRGAGGGPAGDVDGGAGGAQFDGDAAAGTAGGAGDEGYLPGEAGAAGGGGRGHVRKLLYEHS